MNFLTENFFKNKLKTAIVLLLPSFILFLKTLSYDFTSFDEQWLIFKNVPFLEKWSSLSDAFTKPMTEMYYRPFLVLSFIMDYHLGKLSPTIYHFTNLVLHLACVYLLFQCLLSFNVEKKTAFIFSLLFSVHPLVLHATAWIPGRNDLILCVFSLLSLIHLNKFITQNKIDYFLFHILFFCCALFTKENVVLLPIIYIAVYFIFSQTRNKTFYVNILIWLAFSTLYLLLRNYVIPISTFTVSVKGIKDFFLAFIMFIGKSILPFNQSILPKVTTLSVVLGLIGIALIIFLCIKIGFKDKKMAFLGLFIFVVLLIIPVWFGAFKAGGEHYEHRVYTSLAGFMLFLSQLKFNIQSRRFQNVFLLILCVFCIKSFTRMNIYKNSKTFVEAGLKERPDFYLFYQRKGEGLYKEKEYNAALPLFNKAVELRLDKAELYSNRGSTKFSLGMYNEAISDFSQAILKSDFKPEYHLNRCIACNKIGDIENALKDYSILKQYCAEKIPSSLEKTLNDKWLAAQSKK